MRRLFTFVSTVSLFISAFIATAQQPSSTSVPNLMRYSGAIKIVAGERSSGTQGITLAIYKQQDGGAPVWLETQNVTLDANGRYSVLLGRTRAEGLPADLFSAQEERWLGVQVQGQPEQPRVLLVSVPYAMKAAEADRLAGHSASEFVTTESLQSAVQQQLQQASKGATSVIGNGTTTGSNGVTPATTNPATNFVDNTTNQVVQVQQNGTGMALTASAPAGVAILGTLNYVAKPGVVAGVEGTSAVNNGYGMFGYSAAASGGIGIHGRSDSSNGIGLQGWAIGTGGIAINATESSVSGSPIGLVARVSAPNATGALITNAATSTITGLLINAQTGTPGVTQFAVSGSGNVSAAGTFTGTRLISTVATGTAPLQVASTTAVPNLNASLLGGNAASAFALASGVVSSFNGRAGTVVPASGDYSFSQLTGVVGSSQLNGTYTGAVTLSNSGNVIRGDGSGLTGVPPAAGSTNYIQNGTSTQTGANFHIAGNGTLGGTLNANGGIIAGGFGVGAQITGSGSNNLAVLGKVNNPVGGSTNAGVVGAVANTSGGINTGVSGRVNGNTGINTGVSGEAVGTGQNTGVSGTTYSDASDSVGVSGEATSTTGVVYGVVGSISTTADMTAGVVGISNGASGFNAGVAGISSSPGGTGGYFQNSSTQAGSLLIDAVDSNSAQRFTVDNLGNVKVTTGTSTLVTAPLVPVNHGRATMSLTTNSTSTVAVTWAFAFPDTSYTVTCSPQLASGGPQVYLFQVSAVNTGSVSVDVAASGPFPGQLTIHCTGVHD